MTDIVFRNNSFTNLYSNSSLKNKNKKKVALPYLPDQTSHVKHVVYIIKENRTYDRYLATCLRETATRVWFISEER